MLLKDCTLGINSGPLSLEIVSRSNMTEELLKLTLIDSNQSKINMFIEGANLINFFMQPRPGTRVDLVNFQISQNFTQLSQHFPTYLNGEDIATHDSNHGFYIHVQEALPKLTLSFLNRSLQVDQDTNLESLNIQELYEAKKFNPVNIEKIGGNSKCCSLKEISEKINGSTVYSWCYAVVVDSCSSYIRKQGEGSDYIATYKITDPSIFPSTATLTIFHRSPKDLPKVANFGDIIKLNDVQFKEHNGTLTATLPSNTKTMSFYLFLYSGESLSPYANYKSNFHTNAEHALMIDKISEWTRLTFAYEVPSFIKGTKTLASLSLNEEADIRAKVIEICNLGIHDYDPAVLICGDGAEVCQLVIPHERKRLIKFIKSGDLIRLRGVSYEEKVLILRPYSDLLRIPSEFKCLNVICNPAKEDLDRFLSLYVNIPKSRVVSSISQEFSTVPLVNFNKLIGSESKLVKVEGFIVKLAVRRNNLEIMLWDGTSEDSLINVYVAEESIKEFLNGKSWEAAQSDSVGHDCKFQGVIRKDPDVFRLVGTSLLN